jgi:PAS domain-containing protein
MSDFGGKADIAGDIGLPIGFFQESLWLSSLRMRVVVVLEELSKIARKLGRFDAEDSLVRMLASLVTASREFIGVADLEGNALFVNDAGRDLVGLRDLEAVRFNPDH